MQSYVSKLTKCCIGQIMVYAIGHQLVRQTRDLVTIEDFIVDSIIWFSAILLHFERPQKYSIVNLEDTFSFLLSDSWDSYLVLGSSGYFTKLNLETRMTIQTSLPSSCRLLMCAVCTLCRVLLLKETLLSPLTTSSCI